MQCPGCFNPETHNNGLRLLTPVERLVAEIEDDCEDIEGITVSGGEPLEQAEGLAELLRAVRERTRLSVVLFSGYTLGEIKLLPHCEALLSRVDVLVAGRFVKTLRLSHGLRGSSNQIIHLLSDRYEIHQVEKTPGGEICIDTYGAVSVTGVDPPQVFHR